MSNSEIYQAITDRMIAALERGVAPWRKPWATRTQTGEISLPIRATGEPYQGVNIWLLSLAAMEGGYRSAIWLTFNQAKEWGGKVRKGEKGTQILWSKMKLMPVTDLNGDPIIGDDGKPLTKLIPMLRFWHVFNLDQTDGVKIPAKLEKWECPPEEFEPATEPEKIAAAEAIIAGYKGAPPVTETGNRAFFSFSEDYIHVPPRTKFETMDEFYSTLFHEYTHSTGHVDRLDRRSAPDEKVKKWGDHAYGREELVAEMGAAFLTTLAGIETTQDNSAAYLGSWIKTIKADPQAIVWASSRAQAAANHILGVVPKPEEEREETPRVPRAKGSTRRKTTTKKTVRKAA